MSASGGEMRGFVFSITFILLFSTLLASVPVGLQGAGESPDGVTPVDPSLLTGFEEYANWTKSDYTGTPKTYAYELPSGVTSWSTLWADLSDDFFSIAALSFWWIIFIGTKPTKFMCANGTSRGTTLEISEIKGDATDGAIRYSMLFTTTGEDAGSLVVFWNTTAYSDPQDAMDNDVLYLLHGIGFTSTATADIGALLVGLLFLQLPDVPVLVNILIATPLWACIIYILWYIVKEMIPF